MSSDFDLESRLNELDERVRSAASFTLYVANPRHHVSRMLLGLSPRALGSLLRDVHASARTEDPQDSDLSTFIARRLLDDTSVSASELSVDQMRTVLAVINGEDAAGVATVLAMCLVNDAYGASDDVESVLRQALTARVVLPEHGAAMLASCDFSFSQLNHAQVLPHELDSEYNTLGLLHGPTGEEADDYYSFIGDDEDFEIDYRYDSYDDDDFPERRLHKEIQRDPFLRQMILSFDLLPAFGDTALVVPQNIERLRRLAESLWEPSERVVAAHRSVLPAEQTLERLGIGERPRGLVIPSRQFFTARRAISDAVRLAEQSRDYLLSLSPVGFERFMVSLFRGMGYQVEHTALTRDGGADLLCLRSDHGMPYRIAVEVKRYSPKRPIDVSMVRSFVGANHQFGANQLVFVTTSRYTQPALEFGSQYARGLLLLKEYEAIREWCQEVRRTQGW